MCQLHNKTFNSPGLCVQGKFFPMWEMVIRQILKYAWGGMTKSYVPKVWAWKLKDKKKNQMNTMYKKTIISKPLINFKNPKKYG
jgi:hypothetical protein